MPNHPVHTLDLEFLALKGTIASYLIPHSQGVVLVESGPGSTLPKLGTGLNKLGYTFEDITDVLLTHIHLDHAGAAGWLARQGARIHVHPIGAPHMLDPEKLLSSATRIYGDKMDELWGEFLPVPENSLTTPTDNQEIVINDLHFRPLDTPGHARHHYAYIFQDVCFSGDIGGVRLQGSRHLRVPMPPPEFHLEDWRASLRRLQTEQQAGAFKRIAPTHFGIFEDAKRHLAAMQDELDAIEAWMEEIMPKQPEIEKLNQEFTAWVQKRSEQQGVTPENHTALEAANPSWMSPYGMQRYWRKFRLTKDNGN